MDENSMPTNLPVAEPGSVPPKEVGASDILAEVARKISEAQNVLVALSNSPSVDEMAAAIGLTLFLDRLGKKATAIYSGSTPNALEFLKPEDTFEPSAGSLQDFVIALNKEKADHIRYKLDGDYVKVYVTPYKERIDAKDLDFAYGDYNVDLVLALDVANGVDLDSALREHGRIMHDAAIINITTGNPGKFGEIEWSDEEASSISEMIAKLLYSAKSNTKIEKDDATAFLTGIVAATNRFSNKKTTPVTMQIASQLMESGANQQLVSKNITPDVENELYSVGKSAGAEVVDIDPTKLQIVHEEEVQDRINEDKPNQASDGNATSASGADVGSEEAALLNDLKAAEASLNQAGHEVVPETVEQPVKIDSGAEDVNLTEPELGAGTLMTDESRGEVVPDVIPELSRSGAEMVSNEVQGEFDGMTTNYQNEVNSGELPPVMTQDSISEPNIGADSDSIDINVGMGEIPSSMDEDAIRDRSTEMVVQPPAGNEVFPQGEDTGVYSEVPQGEINNVGSENETNMVGGNPAVMMAPQVADVTEANNAPNMDYMPMPGQEVLPPPPTPPIDMNMPLGDAEGVANQAVSAAPVEQVVQPAPIAPAAETPANLGVSVEQTIEPTPLGQQPAMQDQVYNPQAVDPGAFKIPGM